MTALRVLDSKDSRGTLLPRPACVELKIVLISAVKIKSTACQDKIAAQ